MGKCGDCGSCGAVPAEWGSGSPFLTGAPTKLVGGLQRQGQFKEAKQIRRRTLAPIKKVLADSTLTHLTA